MTLVYLALAWGCGIWLAHLLWAQRLLGCATPGWPFGAAAGLALAGLATLRHSPRERLIAALVLFALLGAWRYHAHPFNGCQTPADLAFYHGGEEGQGDPSRTAWATVEGVVVSSPDVRGARTLYRLRAETLALGGVTRPVRGDALVQASRFPEYGYGDRLRVTGQLQTPPVLDDFDYWAYLARQGIHSLLRGQRVERLDRRQGNPWWAALDGLRSRGSALLNRVLPEPAAALANGITLGIRSGIATDVDAAFQLTGASHVLVISGSNIALLSAALMAALSRAVGRRRAVLPALVGLAFYVLLVGADSAALRAGLMGGLYILALYLGRASTAHVSLFASALFVTLLNPLALWDIGFQLSFMATLGLILFTPPIVAYCERFLGRRLAETQVRRTMGFLHGTLIVTLAAQVMTLPLIVYYFGRLSLVSLLTNALILPVQPPIMVGGMVALLAGLTWEPLGRVAAVLPWLFLTYTVAIVRMTASLPSASVAVGALGRSLALVYYAALLGGLGLRRLVTAGAIRLPARRAIGRAAVLTLPLWLGLAAFNAFPDGRLHLFFVPGESEEAALIITPAGRRAWVWEGGAVSAENPAQASGNAGAGAAAVAASTRPLLTGWRQRMDLALGPEAVGALWPGAQVIDPVQLAPGAAVRLDTDVTLTRLPAGEGWALLLRYGELQLLLPATLQPDDQEVLLRENAALRVTLLKAPVPGTGAWPLTSLLAATGPQTILWPHGTTYPPDVVAALASRGAARVPPDAIVEVISDGQRLWLRHLSTEGAR